MSPDRAVVQRVRTRADELASYISHTESEQFAEWTAPWRAAKFMANREPALRCRLHRDALLALAGVWADEPNRPGHTSDWLSLLSHLYYDLDDAYVGRVRDLYVITLTGALGMPDLGDAVRVALAELDDARAFLDAIWNRSVTPFSAEWFEQEAKFPFGTILTSFNRKDLFEFLGQQTVRWLQDHGLIAPSTRALEIGCGTGRIVRPLASRVASVHGIDRSGPALEVARAYCAAARGVTFLQNDGRRLPVDDQQFDLIYSFIVFAYIPEVEVRQALIQDAYRALAPGGRLVISNNDVSTEMVSFAQSIGFVVEASYLDDDHWAIGSLRRSAHWIGRFRKPD